MAKKKKASLKPVQRGFATTSTPKRVEPEEQEPVVEEADAGVEQDGKQTDDVKPVDATAEQSGSAPIAPEEKQDGPAPEDWETEERMTVEGVYQGYVERLQEKGEKEVGRILKVGQRMCSTWNFILIDFFASKLISTGAHPAATFSSRSRMSCSTRSNL